MKEFKPSAVTAAALALSVCVQADPVTDQIDKAKALYQEGKFSQALQELQFAAAQVGDRIAEIYIESLPAPLAGWKADEPESQTAAMALVGGGISVKRRYYQDDGPSVEVEMVSDSPMLSAALIWVSNPALMSGGRAILVKGEKGAEEWNESDRSGKITFVIDSRLLLTVSGNSLTSKAPLSAYAEGIDFAKLRAALNP